VIPSEEITFVEAFGQAVRECLIPTTGGSVLCVLMNVPIITIIIVPWIVVFALAVVIYSVNNE
jgi:hypothetical protein